MQITWTEAEKKELTKIIDKAVKSLDTFLDQSGQRFICPFGFRKTFIFPNNDKSTYIKDFLNVMEKNSDYKKIATNNLISKNEVTTLLIKIVTKQYKDIIELVEFFIEQLNDLIKVDLVCIIPNYVLVFDDEVEHFTFGDSLKCIKSENLESEYAENKIKIVTDYPSRDYTEGIPVLISPDANYSDLVHRLPTK
ncbi:hypothetical protein Megvenef_01634 [Candidatus Megaera venefica]|uniref:Uncharacterized protein n=1 Tax=Candidatus Megaera venefica TaxID=2055910 RepID=A0ABU5NES4_9RICK|nr:hypothetical protein [Candidatus Megaera venefica]MEA0971650.1 hypothetical protein [Candidatus Megaera venefica]